MTSMHRRPQSDLTESVMNLTLPVTTQQRGTLEQKAMPTEADRNAGGEPTEKFGFLLLPEFPMYAFILATEALRVANQNAGARLFSTHLISLDGRPVSAGNGMTVTPDFGIADVPFLPNLLVFACNHPTKHLNRTLHAWLRRLERHGALIGAVDTGQFALAEAGLLDGYSVALHWEAMPMFREAYPAIDVRDTLFTIDRNRITCAGGVATLDMMLHLIANKHGRSLAEIVANGLVRGRIRHDGERQRVSADDAFGPVNHRLVGIVQDMEANLEAPLSTDVLAARAGISVRQLERLMQDTLSEAPSRYYLKLRLQAARNHLFYGDMPIQDIAQACGFSSPSVLSRAFKEHFGVSPREFRRQFSADRLERFRPELRQQFGLATHAEARLDA
jgi:AraC family transcriptional regulator, carnitine catabolism transcriptional activator